MMSIRTSTNCWFYSNTSQILLQHKTQEYYNKFDFMKSSRQSVPKTIELTGHLGQWQALICWPKPGFTGPNDWQNTMSTKFPHPSRARGRALFTGPIGNWLANSVGPALISQNVKGISLICQNTTKRVYGAWLKDIKCNVQRHIAPWVICYNPPLVHDKPPGAPAYCDTQLLQ